MAAPIRLAEGRNWPVNSPDGSVAFTRDFAPRFPHVGLPSRSRWSGDKRQLRDTGWPVAGHPAKFPTLTNRLPVARHR